MANFVQPDYRNPSPSPLPTVSTTPHADFVGTGTTRAASFIEPGLSDRDDPARVIRGPNKTKLGF
jgi:hypothetical protein